MKSTLILKNIGDNPSAEITLQVSYFVKANNTSQVKAKEFVITVKPNQDSKQEVDFDDSAIEQLEVLILVQKPKGNIITQKSFILQEIVKNPPRIDFTINQEIDPEAVPDSNIEPAKPKFVYGRLLDKKGLHKMEDIQIIISVKKEDTGNFEPITSVKTEAQGYFSIDYPVGDFKAAEALVGLELLENPIPIKLDEKKIKILNDNGLEEEKTILVFPQRVILIAELKEDVAPAEDSEDCGCQASEFEEKRVLEEFSFYSLVRTSEPAIKGYVLEDEDEITLEDVLKNLPVAIHEVVETLKTLPLIVRKSPIASTKTCYGSMSNQV